MAWAADQKANRLSITAPHRAAQYFPGGIPAGTYAANSITVLTLTAAFTFKGNGQLLATLPHGASLAAGLTIEQAQLLGPPAGPASGSYSGGNHPFITVQVGNSTATGVTTTAAALGAVDLVIVQY